MPPGRYCAPGGARKPYGLQGKRIATPACALVRNDRLGGVVGLEAGAEVPVSERRGQTAALRYGYGGASVGRGHDISRAAAI